MPSEFSLWRNLTGAENLWRQFDQVVCPVDSIKPVERRRGWSKEKLEAYNQERLGDLLDAGWDLIICDEAHRLGGSTEQVARYRLGKALADAAPYLLLLSATPHQGKTAGFQRLMALLDRDEFIAAGSIRREQVAPFVIRTEKRRAINDRGGPLFLPRLTRLLPVRWEAKHTLQQHLYESVTAYVRLGYNQAMRQNRQYLGFLMILMQRLVTSSTQAIASALARRLEALQAPNVTAPEEEPPEAPLDEQDSQEQLDELLATRLAGLHNERAEVTLLLDLARRCQAQGPDARAETLLGILYETQRDANNPELKFLIFTEFVADADHASGLSGATRLLSRLPQRIDGPGGTPARPTAVRREGPHSGLDRRRWRRPQPAVRPHHYQLRPALEPDADRTAHRAGGPYRPEAPGQSIQPDLRGQRRTAGAGSPGREAGNHLRGVRGG